jgi:protein unc-45
LSWAEKFIEVGGLAKLCDLSTEIPELNIESAMEVTKNTRNLSAVLFTRIYENMYYDKAKATFTDVVDACVK